MWTDFDRTRHLLHIKQLLGIKSISTVTELIFYLTWKRYSLKCIQFEGIYWLVQIQSHCKQSISMRIAHFMMSSVEIYLMATKVTAWLGSQTKLRYSKIDIIVEQQHCALRKFKKYLFDRFTFIVHLKRWTSQKWNIMRKIRTSFYVHPLKLLRLKICRGKFRSIGQCMAVSMCDE